MIRLIKYFVQAFFVYLFFIFGKLIGISLSRIVFSFIFKFFVPLFRSSEIINKNLRIFSKNLSKKEKNIIISSMMRNYGMTFIEYVFLKKLRNENSHVKVYGEENLNSAIEKNKPILFVSGHFANFELMSMEITKRNVKLATIYRPLNNIFLNPFMEFLRKKFVCKNQIKKGINGVRDTIEYVKKGYSIALMIDQRVSEGERVNFFGKPALTTTLPAQLALKYNLNVIPVFINRTENNIFEITFQKEIKTSEFKDKLKLTEKLNNTLEQLILSNPNQWIWTHNRWK